MNNRYRTVAEWLLQGLILAIICAQLAFGAVLFDMPGAADVTV